MFVSSIPEENWADKKQTEIIINDKNARLKFNFKFYDA